MDGNGDGFGLRLHSGDKYGNGERNARYSDSEQQYPYLCGYYASVVLPYGARRYVCLVWTERV